DKDDPELLDFLHAQNAWADRSTAHLADLRRTLFDDISARTKQTDLSVPVHHTHTDGSRYWYYTRITEGQDYPRTCRIPAISHDLIPDLLVDHSDEEVLLDVNSLAEGHDFCSLGWSEVSPNGRLLAYSVDTSGDERYDLWVKDLDSGDVIDGPLPGVGAGGAWAHNEGVFSLRVDEAWRPHEVWYHSLDGGADSRVFAEPDARFWVGLDTSRDRRWVIVEVASKTTSEAHLIPAGQPLTPPRCVAPRQQGVEYSVEAGPDSLWIIHNTDAPQFMLSRAPFEATDPHDWTTILPERPDRRLLGISAYAGYAVLSHRTDGSPGITCFDVDAGHLSAERDLDFPEPIYDVSVEDALDSDADRIRFHYESLVTPSAVWEYRLDTAERRLLKQVEVLDHPVDGPYDPKAYVSERLWATSADGTRVPLSVVRHRDTPVDGTAPGLLYGYGSYEIPSDPYFVVSRISLLDRGFVFAIGHVRGGGELGRPWYEQGKELHKRNSFDDFVACASLLIDEGYVAPDRLAAEGGSAGGLLVGAAMNEAPELFRAVHAAVPFVDPVTTILNPELPLTVMEWEEWGNPLEDPQVYASMCSYSPYENIASREYPAVLATTSLHDTRVEVTEPAKWIARLQTTVTNDPDRSILLRTEMAGGHGGVSGLYRAWHERAWQLAWIVDQVSSPHA
ncbi:MAG: S9 family peptidase, partial [Nostocoides sp.]